jgi:hypothetical protein
MKYFCFHFSDQLLRVLVGPVEGSDKKKGVLREIASKWTYRSVEGFLFADVSAILQEHGGLLQDELDSLEDDIATICEFCRSHSSRLERSLFSLDRGDTRGYCSWQLS